MVSVYVAGPGRAGKLIMAIGDIGICVLQHGGDDADHRGSLDGEESTCSAPEVVQAHRDPVFIADVLARNVVTSPSRQGRATLRDPQRVMTVMADEPRSRDREIVLQIGCELVRNGERIGTSAFGVFRKQIEAELASVAHKVPAYRQTSMLRRRIGQRLRSAITRPSR